MVQSSPAQRRSRLLATAGALLYSWCSAACHRVLGRWQLLYDDCWGRELVTLHVTLYCTHPVHHAARMWCWAGKHSTASHSSGQFSPAVWGASGCRVVVTTEEAVYIEIVTRGPEGPVRAGEAGGSGSRIEEERELWLRICIGKETEVELWPGEGAYGAEELWRMRTALSCRWNGLRGGVDGGQVSGERLVEIK